MTSADQLENFSGLLNRDTKSLLAGLDKTKQAAEDAGRAIVSLTSELSNAVSATQIGNILERLQTLASNPFLSSKERAKIEGLIPQAREKMAYMETQELIQVFRGEGPDPRLDPLGASTYKYWTQEEKDFYKKYSDPTQTFTAQGVDENGNYTGETVTQNGAELGEKIEFLKSIKHKTPEQLTAQDKAQLFKLFSPTKVEPKDEKQWEEFKKRATDAGLTVGAFEIQNAGKNARETARQEGQTQEEVERAGKEAEKQAQAQVPEITQQATDYAEKIRIRQNSEQVLASEKSANQTETRMGLRAPPPMFSQGSENGISR